MMIILTILTSQGMILHVPVINHKLTNHLRKGVPQPQLGDDSNDHHKLLTTISKSWGWSTPSRSSDLCQNPQDLASRTRCRNSRFLEYLSKEKKCSGQAARWWVHFTQVCVAFLGLTKRQVQMCEISNVFQVLAQTKHHIAGTIWV